MPVWSTFHAWSIGDGAEPHVGIHAADISVQAKAKRQKETPRHKRSPFRHILKQISYRLIAWLYLKALNFIRRTDKPRVLLAKQIMFMSRLSEELHSQWPDAYIVACEENNLTVFKELHQALHWFIVTALSLPSSQQLFMPRKHIQVLLGDVKDQDQFDTAVREACNEPCRQPRLNWNMPGYGLPRNSLQITDAMVGIFQPRSYTHRKRDIGEPAPPTASDTSRWTFTIFAHWVSCQSIGHSIYGHPFQKPGTSQ